MRRAACTADGWRCDLWFVAILALVLFSDGAAAQDRSLEYSVKASYLFKLAPFVQWPAGTFGTTATPLLLCVIGSDPVADLVEAAFAAQSASGEVVVRHVAANAAASARCHVAYVGRLPGDALAGVLAALRGMPVLTVTDVPADARVKGIVNFVVADKRVRFEMDLQAASDAGLAMSSKLLDLAVRVRPKAGVE